MLVDPIYNSSVSPYDDGYLLWVTLRQHHCLGPVLLNNEWDKMWEESVVGKLISRPGGTEVDLGKLRYDGRCPSQPRFELYTFRLSLRIVIT